MSLRRVPTERASLQLLEGPHFERAALEFEDLSVHPSPRQNKVNTCPPTEEFYLRVLFLRHLLLNPNTGRAHFESDGWGLLLVGLFPHRLRLE